MADVIDRFRELASTYYAATAAVAHAEARANDAKRTLFALKQERRRQGERRFATPGRQAEHDDLLARLDADVAKAEMDVRRISAERDALQERASNAGQIASRARDYLVEHRGFARAELGL